MKRQGNGFAASGSNNQDPFGGFNNQFSTSPGKQQNKQPTSNADPFGGFNNSTNNAPKSNNDPFGNFGGNQFSTSQPKDNGNQWGNGSGLDEASFTGGNSGF